MPKFRNPLMRRNCALSVVRPLHESNPLVHAGTMCCALPDEPPSYLVSIGENLIPSIASEGTSARAFALSFAFLGGTRENRVTKTFSASVTRKRIPYGLNASLY